MTENHLTPNNQKKKIGCPSRWGKLLQITQAARRIGLRRWRAVLRRHGVKREWAGVSDETLDAIMAEIEAIIEKEHN